MSQKEKMRYEVADEARKDFVEKLKQNLFPEDYEDTILMIRRAEYKRGKADGIAESKTKTK